MFGMSIVKINVLTVPDEQRDVLEKRFGARAGSVDSSDGFEWFELLRPVEGTDQYLVYTRWPHYPDYTFCLTASPPGHPAEIKPRPNPRTGLRCCWSAAERRPHGGHDLPRLVVRKARNAAALEP